MKKNVTLALLLLVAMLATAQQRTLKPIDIQPAKASAGIESQGLSGQSAFLLLDLTKRNPTPAQLRARYGATGPDDNLSVSAFIKLAKGVTVSQLARYGVSISREVGDTKIALIPLSQYVDLALSGLCSLIEVGDMCRPTMNIARTTTGVNTLYNGTGYSQRYDGNGVVVGIIDGGFEYAHAAFYDSTGTTLRVKRVWNQKATSGTSPSGYDYGAEYTTTSAIVAAQTDNADGTHGTHVAGIAAGCGGSNATAKQYRGVAPASDIVLVATTMSKVGIFDGIQYIIDYAESVGKPCVINMSLGSHVGPHDGTSWFDRMCDTLLNGSQGIVLVGSAGNEGSDPLHLQKTFTATDTLLYSLLDIDGSNYGTTQLDIWGEPGKSYMAAIAILDTSNGTFADNTDYYLSQYSNYSSTTIGGAVEVDISQNGINEYNNRQNITFYIDADDLENYSSVYRVALIVKSTEAQTLHAWSNVSYGGFIDCGYNAITAGNTDYTVGETGGTGNSMLSVGSYNTRTDWNALDGYHYTVSGQVGELSYFSSHGPTLDNRVKPDVIAPGRYIAAPVNRFNTSYYTDNSNGIAQTTINGVTEYYGVMQGTSMSAPFMAGVVALWLQDSAQLSHVDVKNIAHSTAISDSYTGSIPASGSNLYGWGKVSAAGIVESSMPPIITYTITVNSNNTTMGTVSGGGTYNAGSTATITATANTGYAFSHWQDGNTQNPRTITVSANASYTAYFEAVDQCVVSTFPYTLTLEDDSQFDCISILDNDGDGKNWTILSSSSNPYGHESNTALGSASYDNDAQAALTPDNWLMLPAMQLPAGSAMHLTWYDKGLDANYASEHYSVKLSTTDDEMASYTTTLYSGNSTSSWQQHDVNLSNYAGQTVYIAFRHHNSTDQFYLLIDDIRVGTAIAPQQYTITVVSNNTTMGTVSGGGTFTAGSTTTISATPKEGYRFVRWNDNNTQPSRNITVTSNATYTAYFEAVSTEGIESATWDGITLQTVGLTLTVSGASNEDIVVNDMLGRTVYQQSASTETSIQLPASGIYFVRVGERQYRKVIAMK